jgi:hypothetical protein
MKVKLRSTADSATSSARGWLRGEQEYVVLAIEPYASDALGYRIASDDNHTPALFPVTLFDVADPRLSKLWTVLAVSGPIIELGPVEFGAPDFWVKVFDGDDRAVAEYRSTRDRLLEEASAAFPIPQ